MTTDPWLPARLEREALVRKGEKRVQTAATAYIGQALAVADRAFNRRTGHLDNALLDARDLDDGPLLRVIGDIHAAAYTDGAAAVTAAGPPTRAEATSAHVASVRNRLSGVPDGVFDTIRAELATGFDTGESIPNLAGRVGKMLENAGAEQWKGRAVTIARTETIGAFNAGHRAGTYSQAAAVGMDSHDVIRQWLATGDARTRQSHAEADGQQVRGEDATYQLAGGEVLFPGDPAGPAEEVINCRCTEQFLMPGDPNYPGDAPAPPTGDTGRGNYDALRAEAVSAADRSAADALHADLASAFDGQVRAPFLNQRYAGDPDSFAINKALREGTDLADNPFVPRGQEVVDGMRRELRQYATDRTVVAYRGVNKASEVLGSRSAVGATLTDKGFMSTTLNRDQAVSWVTGNPLDLDPAVIEVVIPKGTHVGVPSANSEWEVVIPDGATLRIVEDKPPTKAHPYRRLKAYVEKVT